MPEQRNADAIETGRRIRASREGFYKDRKMTLAELSQKTGGLLSDRAINNYEHGIRLPRPGAALILGKALRVSAAFLLAVAEEDELNPKERELLEAWRALPEKDRNEYRRRIVALAMAYREPIPEDRVEKSYGKPKRPVKSRG